MQIKLQLVHFIHGRARIVIKSGIEPKVLSLVMEAAFQQIKEIRRAEFNPWAQSVTIYFVREDPYAILDRIKAVLEDIVRNPLFPQQLAQIEDAIADGNQDHLSVAVRNHILSVSTSLDRAVKDMTGNAIDLKTLVPVTSFAAGLMTLAMAPGLPTPTWLVLIIFGFTGFHLGQNPFGAIAWQPENHEAAGELVPETHIAKPELKSAG
jgi:hypothetical protein